MSDNRFSDIEVSSGPEGSEVCLDLIDCSGQYGYIPKDKVIQFTEKVKEIAGVDGWISVDERLPKAGKTVQAWVKNQIEPIAAYLIDAEYLAKEYEDKDHMEHGWYPSTGCMFDLPEIEMNVTHWQPLPAKPVK